MKDLKPLAAAVALSFSLNASGDEHNEAKEVWRGPPVPLEELAVEVITIQGKWEKMSGKLIERCKRINATHPGDCRTVVNLLSPTLINTACEKLEVFVDRKELDRRDYPNSSWVADNICENGSDPFPQENNDE